MKGGLDFHSPVFVLTPAGRQDTSHQTILSVGAGGTSKTGIENKAVCHDLRSLQLHILHVFPSVHFTPLTHLPIHRHSYLSNLVIPMACLLSL